MKAKPDEIPHRKYSRGFIYRPFVVNCSGFREIVDFVKNDDFITEKVIFEGEKKSYLKMTNLWIRYLSGIMYQWV